MSLIEIKNHLMQVKIATLGSLCAIFKADPDMLRTMLQHWVNKGKVRKCMKKNACGSKCFKCPTLDTEFYEWVDGIAGIAIL